MKHQKRPLTPNHQKAIARRRERREIQDHLATIAKLVEQAPAGWRENMANALRAIARNGHVFTLACGKAAVLRAAPEQWGAIPQDLWPFIDRQNAEFARHILPDIVARWNTPMFPELIEQTAPEAKAS